LPLLPTLIHRKAHGKPEIDISTHRTISMCGIGSHRGKALTMREIEELGRAVVEAEDWVNDLTRRLDWHDRSKAYAALLSTLHALRDSLPRNEAIYVGSQLPPLLRGLYYEGWHPAAHISAKTRSAFLERVHEGLHHDVGIDAEQVARAVFALLAARLPPDELEDAKVATPKQLRLLWPS
jgi:uncharacterized protein (DUF2267 family)